MVDSKGLWNIPSHHPHMGHTTSTDVSSLDDSIVVSWTPDPEGGDSSPGLE
jgi:hypothetical protein